MLTKLSIVCFLFFCFGRTELKAQAGDSDTLSSPVESVVQQYKEKKGDNLLLFNGTEYARFYPRTTGTPFVLSDSFQIGSIIYDGILYSNIPLNYNTVDNCVAVRNNDNFLIELVYEKINSFQLGNHFFIALASDEAEKEKLSPGIYELYNYHPVSVFIRHQKVVQRGGNAADPDHFTEYNEYFIKNGSSLYHIKSSKELLSALADESNLVNNYLRQNHLNYKRKPEETLLKAATYYAQLKNK